MKKAMAKLKLWLAEKEIIFSPFKGDKSGLKCYQLEQVSEHRARLTELAEAAGLKLDYWNGFIEKTGKQVRPQFQLVPANATVTVAKASDEDWDNLADACAK